MSSVGKGRKCLIFLDAQDTIIINGNIFSYQKAGVSPMAYIDPDMFGILGIMDEDRAERIAFFLPSHITISKVNVDLWTTKPDPSLPKVFEALNAESYADEGLAPALMATMAALIRGLDFDDIEIMFDTECDRHPQMTREDVLHNIVLDYQRQLEEDIADDEQEYDEE